MDIGCINECLTCPVDPPSVENFSSEAPDVDLFLARSYGGLQGVTVFEGLSGGGFGDGVTKGAPNSHPLGSDWSGDQPVSTCASPISFQEAMLCAFNNWVQDNNNKNWPIPTPDPNDPVGSTPQFCIEKCTFISNGYTTQPDQFKAKTLAEANQLAKYYACQKTLCFSSAKTCTVICPDGSQFKFLVPNSAFKAENTAIADTMASQYACMMAIKNAVCLSPLSQDSTCIGVNFNTVISATAQAPLSMTLSAGDLPPGLQFVQGRGNNAVIFGVPTAGGVYTFSVTASYQFGSQTKQYSITVNEITPSSVPNATVGVAYSQQFSVLGTTVGAVQWRLGAGNLPSGLTLSIDGLLSGTPDVSSEGPYIIDIIVEDGF